MVEQIPASQPIGNRKNRAGPRARERKPRRIAEGATDAEFSECRFGSNGTKKRKTIKHEAVKEEIAIDRVVAQSITDCLRSESFDLMLLAAIILGFLALALVTMNTTGQQRPANAIEAQPDRARHGGRQRDPHTVGTKRKRTRAPPEAPPSNDAIRHETSSDRGVDLAATTGNRSGNIGLVGGHPKGSMRCDARLWGHIVEEEIIL